MNNYKLVRIAAISVIGLVTVKVGSSLVTYVRDKIDEKRETERMQKRIDEYIESLKESE